jgi:prevent-host-death family protein
MSITVNATDANQRFAEILGKAVAGETVIITKHGEPVAQLTPYQPVAASPERKAAWDRMLESMERGVTIGIPAREARTVTWSRDESHER